ncbi:MAG: 4-hydroxythreonine-4-phosphate dehydrogenase PdxA [Candidatus Firestonebacteria bacterium RIFOXYD2_FULL_39_29]|nr:MAG: 4-hydroxythreonine-4-phosphate dehydrogenase PdxA [Candidatus Firestonebacteria bacterium RIFOXYD2_FULL_39_29]
MKNYGKPKLALTMGDPAGIGPEVVLKSLKEIVKFADPIVICDYEFLRKEAKRCKIKVPDVFYVDMGNIGNKKITKGKISALCGRVSYDYIELAVLLAKQKQVEAIVTAPITKGSFHAAGIKFPGHTEMLAALTGTKEYAMMLTGGNLRVVLVTIHTSLSSVPGLITKEKVYNKIFLTACWLKKFMGIKKPVIAVSALNPHAGEGGMFGKEELKEIIPAIIKAKKMDNVDVIGPVVPDTLFYKAKKGMYDAVICMYHDQGLIPLKMTAFDTGVNVTMGLPIIRTSPDHGTAYDIAGKNLANPESFIEAARLAVFMAKKPLSRRK